MLCLSLPKNKEDGCVPPIFIFSREEAVVDLPVVTDHASALG